MEASTSDDTGHEIDYEDSEAIFEYSDPLDPTTIHSANGGKMDDSDDEKVKKKTAVRQKTVQTCEYCGLVLTHPSKIKEHYRTHTGEKPYSCDICGARFSQKTPMTNHYREHLGDLPYSCSFGCGKRFVNNARKNAHELRHIGMVRSGPPCPHLKPPRKVVCPPIDILVPRSENLSNSAVANFVPPLNIHSTRPYQDNIELRPTTKTQSKTVKEKESKCPEVDKRLDDVIATVLARVLNPTPEAITEVVKEGTTKRPYFSKRAPTVAQCTICGLMLKHPSKIAAHSRTHTGEKKFQCGECGLCLSNGTSLQIHIKRIHKNLRKYACEWNCGMSFVSEAVRREHVKIVHEGIKRYECVFTGCSATFSRRCYLMNHRQNVHREAFTNVFDTEQVINEEAAENEQLLLEEDGHDDMLVYGESLSDSFDVDA